MISLFVAFILLFSIGKWFSTLAFDYDKSRWGYAILGIVTYYGGTFVLGIVLGVFVLITGNTSLLELPSYLLGLIAFPFGILAAWILRNYLSKRWEREAETKIRPSNPDLLDDLK